MPDQPYCNQPLPGNSSLTLTPDHCDVNALVCPGMCGLCQGKPPAPYLPTNATQLYPVYEVV